MSIRTRHDEFPLSMPDPRHRLPKRRPERWAPGEEEVLKRIRDEIARRITQRECKRAISDKAWRYRKERARAYRELWALMGPATFSGMARRSGLTRQSISDALRGLWHPDRLRVGTFRALCSLLGVKGPVLYQFLLSQHEHPIKGIPGSWREGTRPRDLRVLSPEDGQEEG